MNERVFDKVLNKKYKLGNLSFKMIDFLFVVCILWVSLAIRIKLMPIMSGDYVGFLQSWMDQIRGGGGFGSLKNEISNYSAPYMYIMCLVASITTNSLYGLKWASIIFDYASAVAVFAIVYHHTNNTKKSILGMSLLLLSPAVFIDSAYWCQCDIIYTCFILYGLYNMFKNRSRASMIFIGIAFSFKLQTLLILPFLIIMWLKNYRVKFRHFIWIPIMYVVMHIPAVIIGRNMGDVLNTYFEQADYYPWGTLNYPNMYYLFDETMDNIHHMDEVGQMGVYICIGVLGMFAYYLYTKKIKLDINNVLLIMLITVAISVYTLPHMHERYGFLLDVICVMIAAINIRRIYIYCFYSVITLLSYAKFLYGHYIIDLRIVSIINGAMIVYLIYLLFNKNVNDKSYLTEHTGERDIE